MPKETPKMAGTMMKTRRRVKRTVREMPRRLTIRLSKGSNRNMVEDPSEANALLPKHRPRPSECPLRQHQPENKSKALEDGKLHYWMA